MVPSDVVIARTMTKVLFIFLTSHLYPFPSLLRFAAKFEWGMTYLLVRDDRGIAPKDAIRGVFDGSFFEYMELTVKSRPHQY